MDSPTTPTTSQKCSEKKITTAAQMEAMLSYLEDHSVMVTGRFGVSNTRSQIELLWEQLTVRLNAIGPPMRKTVEWKKVLADAKNKTKTDMRKIYVDVNKTGGGTSKLKLTAIQERIRDVAGITTTVNGVKGAEFGGDTLEIDSDESDEPTQGSSKRKIELTTPEPKRIRASKSNEVLKELRLQREQARQLHDEQVEMENLNHEERMVMDKSILDAMLKIAAALEKMAATKIDRNRELSNG